MIAKKIDARKTFIKLKTILTFFRTREFFFFLVLFLVTILLRFPQLGYSHFYGDETKALYTDKTIPALEFFMDQRKGPVQFLVVWFIEKLTSSFFESTTRIPFAVAGSLAVFAFYFFVRIFFNNWKSAFFSSLMFSINGFYIAYSRIVQYQSFLLLFSFLSLLFAVFYAKSKPEPESKSKLKSILQFWNFSVLYLFLSSIFFSLAFLSHYDALFYLIPLVYILLPKVQSKGLLIKEILPFFLIPLILFVGSFYLPYIKNGYFSKNTSNYLTRRILGKDNGVNNSLYTISVYNPFYLSVIFLLLSFYGLYLLNKNTSFMFIIWLSISFFVFELVFLNPGTHIHNYLVPLIILSGYSLSALLDNLYPKHYFHALFYVFVVIAFSFAFLIQLYIFSPFFNAGYPWKDLNLGLISLSVPTKDYQLFLYGFPYYRSWDKINEYLLTQKGVRNFYTNDNAVVAKYYLYKYDISPPGRNFVPQYYVYVPNNQEFRYPTDNFLSFYFLEKEFFACDISINNKKVNECPLHALLFKRKPNITFN